MLTVLIDHLPLSSRNQIYFAVRSAQNLGFQGKTTPFRCPDADGWFALLKAKTLKTQSACDRARKERQLEGIAKAKANGIYKGRRPIIDTAHIRTLHKAAS